MPKKKFIDKKKAITFQVVHRSQKDPLAADEDAPQRVLMPMAGKSAKPEEVEKRMEEQRQFGIFFDDEYNYMQHIKSVDDHDVELQPVERIRIESGKLNPPGSSSKVSHSTSSGQTVQLPANVFASEAEEEVGLLNKAAPMGLRLDVDPEIVAAMDEDFDFDDPENELEDNFMELANAEGGDFEEDDEDEWSDTGDTDSDDYNTSDMEDSVPSLKESQFKNADAKSSRFTEYSMSSSVIRRNEQLTLLDDRFEHMMSGYDENEIGALDCDEIEGTLPVDSEIVMRCADEFEKQTNASLIKEQTKQLATQQESDEEEMINLKVEARTREKWDCESILSTYSNIYNHPKLIPREKSDNNKIKISSKTGMPIGVLGKGLTARALATLDAENDKVSRDDEEMSAAVSILSTLSVRPKNETSEERIARKHALKEYRKERRIERKANKLAFKEETKMQHKLLVHNKASSNAVKIV
ncbi:protein LTV1 homolog [Neocloeon triangulifer]|uniref:protein LTV1 homolog n=1 Tax=Neocloeon triangulifer TaxID=2078957 RepID=UPI00286F69CC|nr:protein LTV1 homolog [Neocloeon triangulifer]